jgi:F0F1-type ATP synthase membrane subunit b/b'
LTPGERKQALTDAMTKLADAETDASQLAAVAPPNAKAAFTRIAQSAQQGRLELIDIAEGKQKKGPQP